LGWGKTVKKTEKIDRVKYLPAFGRVALKAIYWFGTEYTLMAIVSQRSI